MITVVSGIAHSGLSTMMRMLQAGGLELLVDPSGAVFDFEKVQRLRRDKSWIGQAENKVVKVITQFLPDLPADRKYKVVLMIRDYDEVLISQSNELKRRGESGVITQAADLKGNFEKHLLQMRAWLEQRSCFEVLEVDYAQVLKNPRPQAEAIAKFLGAPLDVEAMVRSMNQKS